MVKTKQRQYESIWKQIKIHGKATVVAPLHLHNRVIRAVIKEKYMDDSFRLVLSESGIKMKLYKKCDSKNKTITFFLKQENGIRLEDL